jgi:tRNA nucleotidyltransferase (CCA-adding enzyme)
LVDPFRGRADLEAGLIRILHPNSFSDDATRLLRALRYEQRLGFHLEATTEALFHRDVPMLDTISGDRLRRELELILKEERPELVLRRAHELGLLSRLHPELRGEGWLAEKFQQARLASTRLPPSPGLYLSLFFYPLGREGTEQLIHRLKFPRALARTLRDSARLKGLLDELSNPYLLPSHAYRLLQGSCPEAALAVALASTSPLAQERLLLYQNKWRSVKVQLSGDELQQMGVPPGRELGLILESLLEARLDGEVKTKEEEKELVQRWLEIGD